MKRRASFATFMMLFACSEEQSGTARDASSSPREEAPVRRVCEPGTVGLCFCLDGTRSGEQKCSPSGGFEACDCPRIVPTRSVDPVAGPLCPELRGNTSCVAQPYLSPEQSTSVLFTIDRSRSMVCNLPPLQPSADCELNPAPVEPAEPTKWNIVREALAETFANLKERGTLVGLSFFSSNGGCGVDSTPYVLLEPLDAQQRTTLTDSLTQIIPAGETPLVGGTILAYHYLHEQAMAPGDRYVVLLTDGAESCTPEEVDRLLDEEVKKAREANIRTFVIGAPGSENARALLSELAFRGGTASSDTCMHDIKGPADEGNCHVDMTRTSDLAADLGAALDKVSGFSQDCTYAVPPGGYARDVNVQYLASGTGEPQCLNLDEADCATKANGWQFARTASGSEDTTRIVLCGSACERVKQDPKARIDVLIGCKPIILL